MSQAKYKFIHYNGTYEQVHKFGMGCEVKLDEFLSHVVDFLKACGYSYVGELQAINENGDFQCSSDDYDYSNTLEYAEQEDRLDNWPTLRYDDPDIRDPHSG